MMGGAGLDAAGRNGMGQKVHGRAEESRTEQCRIGHLHGSPWVSRRVATEHTQQEALCSCHLQHTKRPFLSLNLYRRILASDKGVVPRFEVTPAAISVNEVVEPNANDSLATGEDAPCHEGARSRSHHIPCCPT